MKHKPAYWGPDDEDEKITFMTASEEDEDEEQPPEVPARDDADRPLPEDAAIKAAHPSRTGRHDLYAEAMRLVGAKHSKRALVDLVNWLLATRAK